MSLEDPFLIVQNEVYDALLKLRNNFTRWTELQENPNELPKEDYASFVTELKNGLKSIQWDLDELEESLENSDRTAKLESVEIQKRRTFITQTREEVKSMNEQISKGNSKLIKPDFSINFSSQPQQNGTKYYRLINAPDGPDSHKNFHDDEHKSPYVPDPSITLDEADHTIHVVNTRHNKMEEIRQLWYSFGERQKKMAVGVVTTAMIILLVVFFI